MGSGGRGRIEESCRPGVAIVFVGGSRGPDVNPFPPSRLLSSSLVSSYLPVHALQGGSELRLGRHRALRAIILARNRKFRARASKKARAFEIIEDSPPRTSSSSQVSLRDRSRALRPAPARYPNAAQRSYSIHPAREGQRHKRPQLCEGGERGMSSQQSTQKEAGLGSSLRRLKATSRDRRTGRQRQAPPMHSAATSHGLNDRYMQDMEDALRDMCSKENIDSAPRAARKGAGGNASGRPKAMRKPQAIRALRPAAGVEAAGVVDPAPTSARPAAWAGELGPRRGRGPASSAAGLLRRRALGRRVAGRGAGAATGAGGGSPPPVPSPP